MLVEDKEGQVFFIGSELENMGCKVVTAKSLEGVKKALKRYVHLSCAFLDLGIYKGDSMSAKDQCLNVKWGLQAARRLKTRLGKRRILICTSFLEDNAVVAGLAALRMKAIAKPIPSAELRRRMAEMLDE